jgi:rhodanese-related sulfurtransferase/SAM-dependent methyltransferase
MTSREQQAEQQAGEQARAARTADDLLAEARAALPQRPGPAEAAAAQADGALLVDIRGDDRRRADGLVPGALVVPRNVLEWRCDPAGAWRHPAISGYAQDIILICEDGFHSSLAAAALQQLGLVNATDLAGGFAGWQAAGLPVAPAGKDRGPWARSRAESDRVSGYWNAIYHQRGPAGASWYQKEPRASLELVDRLGIADGDPVLDVGGGGSGFVAALAARGFTDLTVLDCSRRALSESKELAGQARRQVRFLHEDLLGWQPPRQYRLWHDRALLHFFTEPAERLRYVEVLRSAVAPGGGVIIAAYAPGGPGKCSGLPVLTYSTGQLCSLLGEEFRPVAERTLNHRTPEGTVQQFSWAALTRKSAG